MADEAAKLFPYPDDDPHVISSVQGGFDTFAKHLHTAAGNITSDTSAIGANGWHGDGAAAAKTEITGTAKLVQDAATAMGHAKSALTPYAHAIHDARQDIDAIRKAWRTEHTEHNQAITKINNSTDSDKKKESDRTTENQAWGGLSYGHTVRYGQVMDTLNGAAVKVHTALDKIGSHVGTHKVGSGVGANTDIQLAVTDSLPMLHKKLAAQDAANAAPLIQKAANGDTAAAKELAQKYGAEVNDPYFDTALMNKIGPKGLVELPAAMAKWMNDHPNSSNADRTNMANQNAGLLRFLSTALATATNDSNQPHVDASWTRELIKQGRDVHTITDNHEDSEYDGYWGLGQIMQYAGKKPPYGTSFLKDVGRDMVSWDRDRHKGPKSQDATYSGPFNTGYSALADSPGTPPGGNKSPNSDPLIGLMHAASTNGKGAQQILDYTPQGKDSNLNYLLHDRRDRWTDQGAQLGNALQAASVGQDAESIKISEQAVHILGQDDKAHTSQKNGELRFTDGSDDLSGLRGSMGNILGAHIDLVNNSLANGHDAAFNINDLNGVLADTERDKDAYHHLLVTQLGYMRNNLDYGAASSGSVLERQSKMEGYAKQDGITLGTLLEARGQALRAEGGSYDDMNKELAGYLQKGVGLVPLPKVPGASIAADKAGEYMTSHLLPTNHGDMALVQAGNISATTQETVNQMVDASIIKHNMWLPHSQPPHAGTTWRDPSQPGSTPIKVDFVDPKTGNVKSADSMTPTEFQHFRAWASGSGTVPNIESDPSLTGQTGKSNFDGTFGLKND